MSILNITYRGMSTDCPGELDPLISDADVRRVAVEIVRSSDGPGLLNKLEILDNAFDGFVVDRLQEGTRIYLRPKVPFGADILCYVCQGGQAHCGNCTCCTWSDSR